MISETLEPFFNAGFIGLLWGFIGTLWMFAYWVIKDYTTIGNEINKPDMIEYGLVGLSIAVLCMLTFLVLIASLSIIGV